MAHGESSQFEAGETMVTAYHSVQGRLRTLSQMWDDIAWGFDGDDKYQISNIYMPCTRRFSTTSSDWLLRLLTTFTRSEHIRSGWKHENWKLENSEYQAAAKDFQTFSASLEEKFFWFCARRWWRPLRMVRLQQAKRPEILKWNAELQNNKAFTAAVLVLVLVCGPEKNVKQWNSGIV